MTSYKFIYFNLKGRGEAIRMIFSTAGVPYDDVRLTIEEFQAKLPELPFRYLPILEIDGKPYSQTRAIARYLAKKFGLAGSNELEHLQTDMVVDTVEDLFEHAVNIIFREKDETRKESLRKALVEDQVPYAVKTFEKFVNDFGSHGHMVGKSLTWADIYFVIGVEFIRMAAQKDIIENNAKLQAVMKSVSDNPRIAEWIAKRPASDPRVPGL